jgi:hypothetical protein
MSSDNISTATLQPRYTIFLNRRFMTWGLFDHKNKRSIIGGMSLETAKQTMREYNERDSAKPTE